MAKATGAKKFSGTGMTPKESGLDPVEKLSRDLGEDDEGPRGTQGEPPAPLPTPPTITAEQLEQQIDDAVAQAVAVREAEILEQVKSGRIVTDEQIAAVQRRHAEKMAAAADRQMKKARETKEGRDWNAYYKLLDMVDYAPVSVRVQQFRQNYPDGLLYPYIVMATDQRVVVQSYVYTHRDDFKPMMDPLSGAEIVNEFGQVRPGGQFASTDMKVVPGSHTAGALETAITQAHGRALAVFGYSIHGGIASAEEVEAAQREEERAEREAKRSDAKKSGAKQDSGSGAGAQGGSLPASEPTPPPVKQQQGVPQDLADWHQSLALLLERRSGVIDGVKFREHFGKISEMDLETTQRVGRIVKDLKTREDADAFWQRMKSGTTCTSWTSWPGASPQGRALAYLTAVLQRHESMDSDEAKAIQKAQQGILTIDPFGDTPAETLVQVALDKLAVSVELPAIDPPTEG